jgi:tetratricopeptide (TPR) repeat protein
MRRNSQLLLLPFLALSCCLSGCWAYYDVQQTLKDQAKNQPKQFTAAAPTWAQPEYARLCNQAKEDLEKGRLTEAYQESSNSIALAPDRVESRINLAIALSRLGKPKEAIENLKIVMQMNPNFAMAWWDLASLYQSTGNTREALKTFHDGLTRFPNDENASRVQDIVNLLEKEQREESQHSASKNSTIPGASAVKSSANDYLADVMTESSFRWEEDHMPIKVYVDSGEGVPGVDPFSESTAKSAFAEWEKASKGKVRFLFVEKENDADIKFRWTAEVQDLSQAAEGGETRVIRGFGGTRTTKIQVLTKKQDGSKLPGPLLRVICLHEIGHGLGMMGHSKNADDIMYASTPIAYERSELSKRDSNTLCRLYSDEFKPKSLWPFTWDSLFGKKKGS